MQRRIGRQGTIPITNVAESYDGFLIAVGRGCRSPNYFQEFRRKAADGKQYVATPS
jgi:hypothetical protein